MGRWALALLLAAALPGAEPDPDYVRAQMKIEAIAEDAVPPGSTVTLSPAEANAYVRGEAAAVSEEGLQDVDVRLGTDSLTASGKVNLAKLPGLGNSWIVGSLFDGDTPLRLRLIVTSGDGTATVSVDSVTIGERELDQSTTDFLVGWILAPFFGSVEMGEPFELEDNVERILVRPSGIEIKIAD